MWGQKGTACSDLYLFYLVGVGWAVLMTALWCRAGGTDAPFHLGIRQQDHSVSKYLAYHQGIGYCHVNKAIALYKKGTTRWRSECTRYFTFLFYHNFQLNLVYNHNSNYNYHYQHSLMKVRPSHGMDVLPFASKAVWIMTQHTCHPEARPLKPWHVCFTIHNGFEDWLALIRSDVCHHYADFIILLL